MMDGNRSATRPSPGCAPRSRRWHRRRCASPPCSSATTSRRQIYVRSKQKKADEAGMLSKARRAAAIPPPRPRSKTVVAISPPIQRCTASSSSCRCPLDLDPEPVLELVPAEKDVDGLTELSMGRLVRGLPGHVPCTPLGVMRLLDRYGIPTSGKRAVVVGRSTLVGLPLVLLLGRKGDRRHRHARPFAHPRSRRGVPRGRHHRRRRRQARMITAEHVKPGAAVIDVGVSRTESGIVGDVDFDAVQAVAGAITPMPGGTGPMTIACLLENTLSAARMLGAI